jgi:hypothetical protein
VSRLKFSKCRIEFKTQTNDNIGEIFEEEEEQEEGE